jgi:hypothetical protein
MNVGKMKTEEEVLSQEYAGIIGRTIKSIRLLNDNELKDLYWDKTYGDLAFAIILDDGQVLIPSSDPECNGPGYILLADLVTV